MFSRLPDCWRFAAHFSVFVAGAATVLLSEQVAAQEPRFGAAGHLAISAERMTGAIHTAVTTSALGQSSTASADTVILLGNPIGGAATGYAWPRIALDVFIVRNVSLGAAVTFFYFAPEQGSTTGVLFAPRVGYAARLTEKFALWLRFGFTYERASANSGTALDISRTRTSYALTLEAPMVFTVAPRIAIAVGPTLDLGVGGEFSVGGDSIDQTVTDVGVQAGFLLFF